MTQVLDRAEIAAEPSDVLPYGPGLTEVPPGGGTPPEPIRDIRHDGESIVRGVAHIQRYTVFMVSGSAHGVNLVEPFNQRYGVGIYNSVPLGTEPDGHNTDILIESARKGIPSLVTGADKTPKHTLEDGAIDMLHIIEHFQNAPESIFTPNQELAFVLSMGAMQELALARLAQSAKHKLHGAILLDPCLGKPYKDRHMPAPAKVAYFAAEGIELARVKALEIVSHGVHAARHARIHLRSVDLSPDGLALTWDRWKMLHTGEAGAQAKLYPTDVPTVIHYGVFSLLNDHEEYERSMPSETHPLVRFIPELGLHLTYTESKVAKKGAEQLEEVEQLILSKGSSDDLPEAVIDVLNHRLLPRAPQFFVHLLDKVS